MYTFFTCDLLWIYRSLCIFFIYIQCFIPDIYVSFFLLYWNPSLPTELSTNHAPHLPLESSQSTTQLHPRAQNGEQRKNWFITKWNLRHWNSAKYLKYKLTNSKELPPVMCHPAPCSSPHLVTTRCYKIYEYFY